MKRISILLVMALSIVLLSCQQSHKDYSILLPIKVDDKWGYMDTNGHIVIEAQFDDASNYFSEGLAIIKNKDKYGFVYHCHDSVLASICEEKP